MYHYNFCDYSPELFHIPFFHVVGALHFIDVHADCVFDIRRRQAGVGLQVFKDDTGPVRVVVQELQCFAHQMAFIGNRLKLIQV